MKPSPVYTLSAATSVRAGNERRDRCYLAERRPRKKLWTYGTSASMKINHRCHQLRRATLHNGSLTVEWAASRAPAGRHLTVTTRMIWKPKAILSVLESSRARAWSRSVVLVLDMTTSTNGYLFTRQIGNVHATRPPSCLQPPTFVATAAGPGASSFTISSEMPPYCRTIFN